MKMKNKKTLYESIMSSIAKEVKKVLNELSSETYRNAADKQRALLNNDKYLLSHDDEYLSRAAKRVGKFYDAAFTDTSSIIDDKRKYEKERSEKLKTKHKEEIERQSENNKREIERQIDENNRLSWLTKSIIDALLDPEIETSLKVGYNDIINIMIELGENYWDDNENISAFIKKVLNVNDLANIYTKDVEVMTNHIDELGSMS